MGAGQSVHHDVSVVIVGGGFAGLYLAAEISKSCNVTIIDRSPVFCQNMGALRTCAMPGWTDMVLLEREGNWPSVKQVCGKVTGFNREEKTVTVRGQEEAIKYDYLVLATGSQVPFPGKVPLELLEKGKEEVVKAFNECQERVAAAERIAIVGGGAVGCELAGEIIVQQPDKQITLIHAREHLLDDVVPMAVRTNLEKKLTALGIQLRLGQKVDLSEVRGEPSSTTIPGPATLKTDKEGETVDADLVFVCIGVSVNKCAYEGSLKEEQMEDGYVKVDEYLRVQGEENIFAIGDCNNVPMQKLAANAGPEAKHVAGVLKSIMGNKPMKPFPISTKPTLVLPLGRLDGLGVYQGNSLPTFMIKKLKCHDLMTGRMCSDLKMKAPKYPTGLPPVPKRAKPAAAVAAAPAASKEEGGEAPAADAAPPQDEEAPAAAPPQDEEAPAAAANPEAAEAEAEAAASEPAAEEAAATAPAADDTPAQPAADEPEPAAEEPAPAAEETPAAEEPEAPAAGEPAAE